MKKLSIVLAMALVLAMAVPAMAAEYKVGDKIVNVESFLEIEQTDEDDGNDTLATELNINFDSQLSERVTVFGELQINDDNDDSENNFDIMEAGIDIQDVMGPLNLRAGKLNFSSADDML
ncbi:MAG: hypothetical protein ACQEQI_07865, partial [Bacillota bacterium]